MPDQQIDKGNPNVFTTYRGRYEFTMAEGATCNSPYTNDDLREHGAV